MSKIIKYKFLATAIAAALATPAFAAEGPYVGVSGGEADANDACDGVVVSCDETDTAWKIFAGYQLDPNWGVEAFYFDFGESSASGTDLGEPVSSSADIDGWGAAITGGWPIYDKFRVFGKVGFIYYDLDVKETRGGVSDKIDEDGEGLMYGVGARYSFDEKFAVQVEWERFPDVGDDVSSVGQSDVEFLSAGIVFFY